jgi:rhodanese-related sulfurtransferase
MKNLFLSILAVFGLVISAQAEAANDKYQEINADELQALISEDPATIIIDSRGGSYFDGEVIKGAKQLAPGDTSEDSLAELGAGKDSKIVFYCTNVNCPASAKSASKAHSLGFKNLYKYPGGIDDWKAKGLETEKI